MKVLIFGSVKLCFEAPEIQVVTWILRGSKHLTNQPGIQILFHSHILLLTSNCIILSFSISRLFVLAMLEDTLRIFANIRRNSNVGFYSLDC